MAAFPRKALLVKRSSSLRKAHKVAVSPFVVPWGGRSPRWRGGSGVWCSEGFDFSCETSSRVSCCFCLLGEDGGGGDERRGLS